MKNEKLQVVAELLADYSDWRNGYDGKCPQDLRAIKLTPAQRKLLERCIRDVDALRGVIRSMAASIQ